MTKLEFIAYCNQQRKANKNKWVSFTKEVDGKMIGYKAYNTWVQRLQDMNTNYYESSGIDISVKDYNNFMIIALELPVL